MPNYSQKPNLTKGDKIQIFLPFIIGLTLLIGTWLGLSLNQQAHSGVMTPTASNQYISNNRVEEILRFIDVRYLEQKEIPELENAAIRALLKNLDPHSQYIPKKKISAVKEELQGSFEGIGVEFFPLDDTITVIGVVANGPSAQAGIEVGDKIIYVGDSLIAGQELSSNDIVSLLKGKAKSQVTLKLKRINQTELIEKTLTRDQIARPSIEVAYMLDEQNAYIKINSFTETTGNEFITLVDELVREKNMLHLVLDLRNNPGGYLGQATKVLDQFFNSSKLLVYTEGRAYQRNERRSSGNSRFNIQKVVVLINERSASASEIIAGAVQDNDRGLILGRRSFGKGLVQEQYDLSDGSALRLTVAHYYTPSGRSIQKAYKEENSAYDQDIKSRLASGELFYEDSIKLADSTVYYTTAGRKVYAGGGIMPDIFIPMNVVDTNQDFRALIAYTPSFLYGKLSKLLPLKANYPDVATFKANYQTPAGLLPQLIAFTQEAGYPVKEELEAEAKTELSKFIKAQVARLLFDEAASQQCLNEGDPFILKAVEEIQKGEKL